MARTLSLSLLVCLTLACSSVQSTAPSSSTAAQASATSQPAATPQPAAEQIVTRALAVDDNYVELVRAASALESQGTRGSGCLLSAQRDAYQLAAELSAAIRPLPLPASDLDQALKGAESVELLSAWGRYGNGGATLAFVSFTAHGPAPAAVVLILSDRGIALRAPSGTPFTPRDELDVERALAALAREPVAERLVFVAAEAGVPLSSVHAVLEALEGRGFSAALAVNLAVDTKLPLPASASVRAPGARCESGLPATDAPDGELDPSELTRGLAPLSERLPDCLARGDAKGAAGGRVTLSFRINQDGRVQEACLARDDIGDLGVAACVIELARTLRFTPPWPSGVLDIELPLALRQPPSVAQRPTCSN